MSYILDALKKAEADRDPDARASLAMAQHDRRRNRWLAYAAVIALIANAAILLWLFMPEPEPASSLPPAPSPQHPAATPMEQTRLPAETTPRQGQSPVEPRPSSEPVRQTPVNAAPAVSEPIQPPVRNTMAAESATGETIIGPGSVATLAAEPMPVSSLPAEQRRRFPDLEFSTHIYADDADLRAIVVNGTRLEEGDRLENLRLEEITEDGAVFRFENRLVSVSVLDAWD